MMIRPVNHSDAAEWLRLRIALFGGSDAASERAEIAHFLAKPPREPIPTLHAAFVCERSEHGLCGMAEASIRPYADGCDTNDVGYLEARYVDPDSRRLGIGRALVRAAEQWAIEQGCREMASDAVLENLLSQELHQRLGYAEVGRIVQFCKPLVENAASSPK